MAIVIGIKFKSTAKTYFFDPTNIDFAEDDYAIVDTARGIEFGKVVMANKDVDNSQIIPPLKPVIRKATDKDHKQNEENLAKRSYLVENVNDKVCKHNLQMKVVDAEYTFDRSKVIIYFTAENRIDFRELVKDLASVFRVRIELRQIYERDDIKMRGSLASCGRPCCCISFLQDYDKVSIKMAKIQNLSLSPTKISGCCGKLMCCLRFENDHYTETLKKMPKVNSSVNYGKDKGWVLSTNLLKETVRIRIEQEDGSVEIKEVPLAEVKFACQNCCKGSEQEDDDKE